ncbi:MAG: ring,2-phenylacetyl-CoA epoxidase subunit PaaD [Frankiaceae bacterium]|nr:ring,2-phenylacetyl-CoA epoxidase subunit PaaD [Frankiaceae bacterium]
MTETTATVWDLLATVPDPEIPALSVVDLGIVREVEELDGNRVRVTLTPTYSGCPATEVIARDVRTALENRYAEVEVRTRLSPAWTTDWMSDEAKGKLLGFGIAPPSGRVTLPLLDVGAPTACPHCGSGSVEELAGFGSTPCKALWRCRTCREPFDYFKKH